MKNDRNSPGGINGAILIKSFLTQRKWPLKTVFTFPGLHYYIKGALTKNFCHSKQIFGS